MVWLPSFLISCWRLAASSKQVGIIIANCDDIDNIKPKGLVQAQHIRVKLFSPFMVVTHHLNDMHQQYKAPSSLGSIVIIYLTS